MTDEVGMLSLRLSSRAERLRRNEFGFTLIELLVVIIIIGVLAAIAIPLFLDQRKLAVDASVKSDVRNTATQVQTWLASNPGQIATDATDYQSKGGNVAKSTGNTVGVSVATDGSYLVCGYAGTAAKAYTAAATSYVYDSASGKFGLGSCTGGLVGAAAPTPVSLVLSNESASDPYYNKWTGGTTTSGYNSATARSVTGSGGTTRSSVVIPTVVGKSYTVTAWTNYAPYTGGGSCCSGVSKASINVQSTSGTSPVLGTYAWSGQAAAVWTKQSFTFTATDTTSTLSIEAYLNGTFGTTSLAADDITITSTN
jgi:type IV pilus assembly protein PilA